jgi:hypothetical protein
MMLTVSMTPPSAGYLTYSLDKYPEVLNRDCVQHHAKTPAYASYPYYFHHSSYWLAVANIMLAPVSATMAVVALALSSNRDHLPPFLAEVEDDCRGSLGRLKAVSHKYWICSS